MNIVDAGSDDDSEKPEQFLDYSMKMNLFILTSSNLAQMSLKAVKMASVLPVTVTTRSGQEPSLMLIFAPDCEEKWKR